MSGNGAGPGGKRNHPEQLREAVRNIVKPIADGIPTASFGEIMELDEETRRATVKTIPDGVPISNVPVASSFAYDGGGDVLPLNPEYAERSPKGVVIYLHHPIDRQLESRAETADGEREHDDDNAVFLPAQIWFDGDEIPDTAPGERRIGHPSGAAVRMTDEGIGLTAPDGSAVGVHTIPTADENAPWDGFKSDMDDDPDQDAERQWPPEAPGETAPRVMHSSGVGVTVADYGTSIMRGKHRPIAGGRQNDGGRRILDGLYGHSHIVDTPDGPVISRPHPTFREWIALLTVNRDQLVNSADPWVEDASIYAQAYLEWLEDEVGEEIDPTDPYAWPSPEPMPTPEEKAEFDGGST